MAGLAGDCEVGNRGLANSCTCRKRYLYTERQEQVVVVSRVWNGSAAMYVAPDSGAAILYRFLELLPPSDQLVDNQVPVDKDEA